LHHRIEVCTTITTAECKKELIDYFNIQWSDNDKMVELSENLEQHKVQSNSDKKMNAQESVYFYVQQTA
jgi:polyphosphate kinase